MSLRTDQLEMPLLVPSTDGAAPGAEDRRRRLDSFLGQVRALHGVRSAELARRDSQPTLVARVDPALASTPDLEAVAQRCGIGFKERRATVVLGVQGMVSRQSEGAIEAALASLPGVRASASFPAATVRIEFDRAMCALPDIALRLGRLGFRVYPTPATPPGEAAPLRALARLEEGLRRAWALFRAASNNPLIEAVGGAIFLILGFVLARLGQPASVTTPLFLLSYIVAGSGSARDTLVSLSKFRLNIDVLMFAAAIGAGVIGRLPEGALLLVLFAFGHAGETIAMERARRAVRALHDAAPDTAVLRAPDGSTSVVAAASLRVGDTVLIRPGDRVAADGRVLAGVSAIDQSAITGESVPVEKAPGARVFAGTLNGDGALDITVDRPPSETTLAKAIRLVEEAQTRKGAAEMLAARVERWYVPIVLGATALLFVIPPLVAGGGAEAWRTWFYRSVAFLTAASPCALAIGAPATTLSALARAARMGVLIKGGVHLETLGRLRAVAFDKTGTLTVGRPRVVRVISMGGGSEADVLAIAAALEGASAHPLARAIVQSAHDAGARIPPADAVEQVVGKGLRGEVAGETVEVGSPRMFETDPAFAAVARTLEGCQREGQTAVAVRRGGRYVGVIALADEPRESAARAIEALQGLGIRRLVMLTGDHEGPAAALARRLGLDEHHASLLPEDKMRILGDLRDKWGTIAMVGDGVNDAPALAAASVGVAVAAAGATDDEPEGHAGAHASDVALETADIALMHDDLMRFPDAVRLARFARTVMLQNLVLALGVILILAPAAALGQAGIGWAVVFHEGSTVVVVLNALRLLAFKTTNGARRT